MRAVALATEDELSEAVGLSLISEQESLCQAPPLLLRKQGFGYLRSKMDNWKRMAEHQTVVILTDLDRVNCPVKLLADWLGQDGKCPPGLVLRIAVREIEAWVLADHVAMRGLIGKKGRLPSKPDDLADPKQHLLRLAESAPRSIREDLVAERKAMASQGIGYNRRLTELIRSAWDPERAAERSPSLARARRHLARVAGKP